MLYGHQHTCAASLLAFASTGLGRSFTWSMIMYRTDSKAAILGANPDTFTPTCDEKRLKRQQRVTDTDTSVIVVVVVVVVVRAEKPQESVVAEEE